MEGLGFRKAEEADLSFLMALRETTMRAHIENTGFRWNPEVQREMLEDRYAFARIVMFEGRDVGLLKVDRESHPWMIVQIQLAPEFQGKGLGEKLLKEVLAEAREAGVCVNLEVLAANPAKRLYDRLGFRRIGGDEKLYLMQWGERKAGLPDR